uniref:Protein LBH n=1 Tax=Pogona vitticeps TaxID=103695 RepID=A0A6J0U109_9SAUR
MTERMGGCEGPEGSAEAYASCPMPTEEGLDPSTSDEGGLNADHEMQWLSARENLPLQAPSLDSQLFLSPPQGLGADLLGDPPSEPGEELSGEACEEMCIREAPEVSCRGRRHGLPPCGPLCPGATEQSLYEEDHYGQPWAGKDRLPSIVVEPSEGEVESGELRWPPETFSLLEEEGEDPDPDELFAEGEEALETGESGAGTKGETLFGIPSQAVWDPWEPLPGALGNLLGFLGNSSQN